MKFTDYLTEVKSGRAWSGKLKKIDSLLSWMYEKKILSKGEQKEKDSIFHQYYRFYNDGDLPRGFGHYSHFARNKIRLPPSISKEIEEFLEEKLETFIKKILSKYSNRINRGEFRIDQEIKRVSELKSIIADQAYDSFIKYWIKDAKDEDVLMGSKLLKGSLDEINKIIDKYIDDNKPRWEKEGIDVWDMPQSTHMLKYKIEYIIDLDGKIPEEAKDLWDEIQEIGEDIMDIFDDLLKSFEELKKLKLIK